MKRSRVERALVPLIKRHVWAALVPWTPCMVTGLRIALAPVIAYLFAYGFVVAAVALFMIAAWTDWLDGVLARALDVKSDFGAFLDATADKVLILSLLFAASASQPTIIFWLGMSYMQAVWMLAAIEAALTVLRLPRLVNPRVNVHAGEMGKWKFRLEVLAVFEVMVLGGANLLPVAIVFGVFSLIEHLAHYRLPAGRQGK